MFSTVHPSEASHGSGQPKGAEMYQRILLTYNATAHNAEALHQAGELARLAKADLHMLGIVVTTGGFAFAQASGLQDAVELERQRVEQAVTSAAKALRDDGVNVTASIGEGEPANLVLACARRFKADLIVLGPSNQGILARWFQGSLGAQLLSNLPCSMLIAT
jgi:nucleotide-binding universal stress UspA family protein